MPVMDAVVITPVHRQSESHPWSNSRPIALDVFVRRACFPSMLSIVW